MRRFLRRRRQLLGRVAIFGALSTLTALLAACGLTIGLAGAPRSLVPVRLSSGFAHELRESAGSAQRLRESAGSAEHLRDVHPPPSPLGVERDRDFLRLVSLNLAHGRRDGFHQLLQSEGAIRENLRASARVIERVDADVVALQEADGPSFWSGGFDHVSLLAEASGLAWNARAENVRGLDLSYGTAVAARVPIESAEAITFRPSPPTFSKGVLVATIPWPGHPGRSIDVVSVHLDFARESVRTSQVDELAARFAARERPLVIAGDFNSTWQEDDSPIVRLAEALDLETWRPEAEGIVTFPLLETRIDWVLVSEELEILDQRILDDVVSDHRVVVTDLRLR